jgi:hypothetical protein
MRYSSTVLLRTKGSDAEQGGGQGELQGPGTCPIGHVYVKTARADRGQVTKSRATVGIMELGFFVYHSLFGDD